MKILVAGATGNTGSRLVKALRKRGHTPIAMVREGSDTGVLEGSVSQRQGDLTNLPDDICTGCDAVIFAAGSGGQTGAEMTDKVDRDGAKRLVDLARAEGVRRFVMLSSAGAENPDPDSDLGHYMQAKHDADEHLKASGLDYAILRPVTLTEDDATGSVKLGEDVDMRAKAARGDVAETLADAVESAQWSHRVALMQTA